MERFLYEVENYIEDLINNGTLVDSMKKLTATLISPQQTNEWTDRGLITAFDTNNNSKYRLLLVIGDDQSNSIIASKMIYTDQISDDFDCLKDNGVYRVPINLD